MQHDDGGTDLLKSLCTKEELEDWQEYEGIWAHGPVTGRWYFVTQNNVAAFKARSFNSANTADYCIVQKPCHFNRLSCVCNWPITSIDLIVAKKMLIQCSERTFLRLARGA